jgi:glycosidase
MLTFLDNHDMDRFLHVAGDDIEILKDTASIQFSFPSPAIIYQGTEFAMTHEKSNASFSSYGDLVARKMVPWEKGNGTLFKFYQEIILKKAPHV